MVQSRHFTMKDNNLYKPYQLINPQVAQTSQNLGYRIGTPQFHVNQSSRTNLFQAPYISSRKLLPVSFFLL